MTDAAIIIILFVFVAFCALVVAPLLSAVQVEAKAARERGELPQFDERQRAVRSRAALHAFVFVLIYLVAWACLDLCGTFAWTKEVFVVAVLAVILAYGVWMGECILRDVAIGWNIKQENRKLPLYILFLCNVSIGVFFNAEHTGIKVVTGAFWITGFVMMMLQSYVDRRKKKAEKLMEEVCEEVEEM